MSTTDQKFGARVVVCLTDEFASAVNDTGLQYADKPGLDALKAVLADENATLVNVMRDFEYYVEASDAHGADPTSPIIAWTRDSTENPRSKAYFEPKFVIMVGAGVKVFDPEVAEKIASRLRDLEGQGVVKEVRVDSMDPAQNPPIPERYFE